MAETEPVLHRNGVECDRLHCGDTIGACEACPEPRRCADCDVRLTAAERDAGSRFCFDCIPSPEI